MRMPLTYLAGAVAPSEPETVMAAPITKKEIQKLPIHRYDTIRDDIQTGDLFFCSGACFFRTPSKSAHSGHGGHWIR
jgi:hypothetical protein